MKLSVRYGILGIGLLALLSLAHWIRGRSHDSSQVSSYLLGALPNLLAALSIPFVLLGIWADRNPNVPYPAARRWFIGVVVISGIGLITWELLQYKSRSLVFDFHDIGATVLGLCLASLLFVFVTPKVKN